MYTIKGDQKYLDEAKKNLDYIVGHIVQDDGRIYDGYDEKLKKFTRKPWSYNYGSFLGCVAEFYKITGDITYMETGEKAIKVAMSKFNKIGIFSENIDLNSDQQAFKGIFFKYMSKFLVEYWKVADDKAKDWIREMKDYTISMANIVVRTKMDPDTGLFSAYWSPDEDMVFTSTAQISAMDLFVAAHRL